MQECTQSITILNHDDWDREWCKHGRVAYIMLANDERGEQEIAKYFPKGFGLHFARLPGSTEVTRESLMSNFAHLRDCARRLCVSDLKVICFACTAASFLIGTEKVKEEILMGARERDMGTSCGSRGNANGSQTYFSGRTDSSNTDSSRCLDVIPTSLTDCVLEALKTMLWRDVEGGYRAGAANNPTRNIVVLTPYVAEVNQAIPLQFESMVPGLKVVEILGLGIDETFAMHRPSSQTIHRLCKDMFLRQNLKLSSQGKEKVDGIFVSCACLPSVDATNGLEAELRNEMGRDVPVVTSLGSELWHVTRLAGYQGAFEVIGMLGNF